MTPEQFVYWLRGYMEIVNPDKIDVQETAIIKQHLDTVFNRERNKSDQAVHYPYLTIPTDVYASC